MAPRLPSRHGALVTLLLLLSGCSPEADERTQVARASSCMLCHNGSKGTDYSGPGIEDPHPFPGADHLACTTCHGGNDQASDKTLSHVPPPPEVGDLQQQTNDPTAYFNRLTLAGLDKFPDYQANNRTYTALDYLQFVNPGDLRVVTQGRSCGQCHQSHASCTGRSMLASESGILSGAMYAIGATNQVPQNQGLYEDTAVDTGFRANSNPNFTLDPTKVGAVGTLLEHPVYSVFGKTAPDQMYRNPLYNAAALASDVLANGAVRTNSPLANLFSEQIAFTCGDCHLGSAGANNRYGDFRSSGCTACHMPYSQDGRSRSQDPNVNKLEPVDPDDIDAPERAHVRAHRIANIAKTLPSGQVIQGIDDHTCAGCHQGSNRTVMQYWGIRLDQNADLRNRVQYPANPVSHRNTRNDTRLFDPAVGNRTFNGRNADQYIVFEDYDGDQRDDTPEDVHYAAGLGCIDCHGSHDLHGGDVNDPNGVPILSRMEQAVSIQCENCHGSSDSYALTVPGTTYAGQPAEVAVDAKGLPQRHVTKEIDGNYYLTSRLDGRRHYVPQTRDVVVNNGKIHPIRQTPIYNAKGSYAMGRADSDPSNGLGPQQSTYPVTSGFAHSDTMDCASCHASWTNTCMGCHLKGEYSTNPNNHSNITGERIVYRQTNADFTYQSPLFFQLGISAHNKITQTSANTKVFYQYRDSQRNFSKVFAFTDRKGGGNNPAVPFPSLAHNVIMAHSIRGRVDTANEGPRYCVACHLTQEGLNSFGSQYATFRTAMANNDFASLDFALLQTHFGQNPGNQINSPLWVHMVAGLGSGVFLFDENGCPVNPLDDNANRFGCDGVAPASNFSVGRVALNLDRIVLESGVATGSNNHTYLRPGQGPNLRDGALDPNMTGPMGATLLRRLTDPVTGIVLDSWLDADGLAKGNAPNFVGNQ